MDLSDRKTKLTVVAAVSAVAVAGITYLWWSSEPEKKIKKKIKGKKPSSSEQSGKKPSTTPPATASSSSKPPAKKAEPSSSDGLSKAEFEAVLNSMIRMTKQVISQLGQMETAVRQTNPTADRQLIVEYLSSQYNQAMQLAKAQVYIRHKTNEPAVQQAAATYESDSKIQKLMGELEAMDNMLAESGIKTEDPVELQNQLDSLPAELTMERVTDIFKKMMSSMASAMNECIKEIEEADPPIENEDAKKMAVQQMYMAKANEVKDAILEEFGLTEETLDLAIRKYQSHPEFARMVVLQQEEQAKHFRQRMAPKEKKDDS